MQALTTRSATLSAALALALGAGFAPAANALATYDASASFALTLDSVTDATGGAVSEGFLVEAEGFGSTMTPL